MIAALSAFSRGALVLLVALVAGNASAAYSNNPADTIPAECVQPGNVRKILDYLIEGNGTPSYYCVASDGKTYNIDASYVKYAMSQLKSEYKTGSISIDKINAVTAPNLDTRCSNASTNGYQLGYDKSRSYAGGAGWIPFARVAIVYSNNPQISSSPWSGSYTTEQVAIDSILNFVQSLAPINKAYGYTACWIQDAVNAELTKAFANGYRQITASGQPDTSPFSSGTTGGSTPTATTEPSPACTKADGTTSGNPYDCAPSDAETLCGIIDIPCNLKKLFIPRSEFLNEKLKGGVGLTVKFPITVAESWMFPVTLAGQTFDVGLSFAAFDLGESAKDQFRFLAWWGAFLFLLAYIGLPIVGGRRGMADAGREAIEAADKRNSEALAKMGHH